MKNFKLDVAYYGYWIQNVGTDIIRSETGKVPTTSQKVDFSINRLSEVEKLCGDFPAEYKKAIDAVSPLAQMNGSKYVLTSSTNFKNNDEAQKALDNLFDNFSRLTTSQTKFIDNTFSWYSSGGYYFTQTNLNAKNANTFSTITNLVYLELQDLYADGADPRGVTSSSYVKRTGSSSAGYTYNWVNGKNAQIYIDDFNKYEASYQKNVIDIGLKTIDKMLEMTDSMDDYKDVSKAVNAVKDAGIKVLLNQSVSVDEVQNAIALKNSLSADALRFYSSLASSTYCKVLAQSKNVYTNADELTPEALYKKSSSISASNLSYCLNALVAKVNDLLLEEFNDYVKSIDLATVNESVVTAVKEKYVELPDSHKSKIADDVFDKYMKIVKPEADHNDFSSSIKDYKATDIVRPYDSRVAWTVGGIQSAVDKLWYDIGYVGNIAAPQLDLKNGLDTVLKTNVYTTDMVTKIFDLYATLSRSDLDLGVLGLTLGGVISLICAPSNIASALEETKYSKAVQKINDFNKDFKETEEVNPLEGLAQVQFTSGDFGFEDGDRAGFIDALLAVLRPLTNLLAPGAKALGLVSMNVEMFDYINADGDYTNGVYANLIPALEAAGFTAVPTEQEYKDNYYAVVSQKGKNIAADEFLRPLLNTLCGVIDEVSPDPLNGLIKYLPSISYVIGTNMLRDCVKSALEQAGLLSDLAKSLDLSGDWINHKLCDNPLVINGASIQLRPIDWLKLGNCATVSSAESKSNDNDYLMLRTGDTDTCFTTVFYYLYDVLLADEDNYAQVKKLLSGMLNSNIYGIVADVTDKLVSYGNVEAYSRVLYWLGTEGQELIDSPDNPFIEKEQPATPVVPTQPTAPTQPNVTPSTPATQPSTSATATTQSPDKTTTKTSTKKTTKPKKTSISKLKKGKKQITVYWKKITGVKGYQVQVATDKKFKKNKKTVTISKQKTTKTTVKKLKAKKKYYVRVRTYKTVNGKKIYSSWSAVKSVKTK